MSKILSKSVFIILFLSINTFAAKCPSGQHWDTSMHMCMPNPTPTPTPKPECPTGQVWDASMNMCMPITPPPSIFGN